MNQVATITSTTGDLANFQDLRESYQSTKKGFETAKFQATTGLKGRTYKEIAIDAEAALAVSVAKDTAQQYKKNMDLIDQRLDQAETGVQKIISIMGEFNSRLRGVVQSGNRDTQFQSFCENSLKEIAQTLNSQDYKRNNIFGGNELTKPPVNLAALPNPILGGGVSTAYYDGNSDIANAPISEGKVLTYGVNADNSAFAKTLHALKIGASIAPDFQEGSNNMQLLRGAMDVGNEATTELSETLAAIGTDRKTIERQHDILDSFLDKADNLEKGYIATDIPAAWVMMKSLEIQQVGIASAFQLGNSLSKQLVSILS